MEVMFPFFENPGLLHIGKKILKSMDIKTQATCRLVCKSWNNHVEDLASKISVQHLQQLLEKFTEVRSMTESEKKKWTKFFVLIFQHREAKSNKFIKSYLKHVFTRNIQYGDSLKKSPMFEFVHCGNTKMVEFNNMIASVSQDHDGVYRVCNGLILSKLGIYNQHTSNQSKLSGVLRSSICN